MNINNIKYRDNIIFDSDGNISGFIDFEEICYDDVVLDVCITIHGCCYTKENQLDINLMKTLVRSYHEEYTLTDTEISLFHKYMIYASLELAFWRFRQFNVVIPGHESAESYKEMWNRCNWILENKSIFEKTNLIE